MFLARIDDSTILGIAGLPLLNQDEEKNTAPQVAEFRHKIRAADAILSCGSASCS